MDRFYFRSGWPHWSLCKMPLLYFFPFKTKPSQFSRHFVVKETLITFSLCLRPLFRNYYFLKDLYFEKKSAGEGDYIFPKSVKQLCCIRHFNSIKRNRSDAKILVKSIMSNRSPVNMYHYSCLSRNFWVHLHLLHILCVPVIYVCVTDCKTLSISFSSLPFFSYALEMTHGLILF